MPQQMQSVLAGVAQALLLPDTVGTATGQLTGVLAAALRKHRQTIRALAGCARLADLLKAEPDIDALPYYPHLPARELARLPSDQAVVRLPHPPQPGTPPAAAGVADAEGLLHHHRRNRLQWADPEGDRCGGGVGSVT
ncbi:hypothetical protein ACFC09_35270 [Streptomyces sp. NPDC056161]|uniref:hypothetical protein n=1 Tax=Streptomyces sp. NPDC056161 TaxID=3345732 RepID=UPI0035E2AB5B